MSKRANGEGNVRQRADGRWEGSVSYVDTVTGDRRRSYVYGKTAAEARRELRKVRKCVEDGQPAKDAPDTVASWLKRWRESSLAASDRKATTKALYGTLSRVHLEAEPFRRDGAGQAQADAHRGADRGPAGEGVVGLDGTAGVHRVAPRLDVAVRDGLIASNPAAKVKRPGIARKEARYLSAADVVRLLDAAKGLRYYLAVVVMATTGLRRGEVAGLLWSAIDLDKGELMVRHTLSRVGAELLLTEPKTDRSRRRVPLHAGVVTQLKAHRTRQLQERLQAGDQWTATGAVFATEFGTMVDPRNLLRAVEIAARKAGIEDVGAHTMRHSAATAWLESGPHIRQVSDLLGHSSIAITGDIYGHPSENAARSAVDGLGTALGL